LYRLYIEFYSKNKKDESILKIIEIEYPSKKGFIEINKRIEEVLNA